VRGDQDEIDGRSLRPGGGQTGVQRRRGTPSKNLLAPLVSSSSSIGLGKIADDPNRAPISPNPNSRWRCGEMVGMLLQSSGLTSLYGAGHIKDQLVTANVEKPRG
jgi:hypothetical protein